MGYTKYIIRCEKCNDAVAQYSNGSWGHVEIIKSNGLMADVVKPLNKGHAPVVDFDVINNKGRTNHA